MDNSYTSAGTSLALWLIIAFFAVIVISLLLSGSLFSDPSVGNTDVSQEIE